MNEFVSSVFRNQWQVFLLVGFGLLALAEIGFRVGLRLFVTKDKPRKDQIGGIQGAVLGMLALLLGFTFSMAMSRYENRRNLGVQEANSIGTTFLRASVLPEAHKSAVEAAVRRYVDARLEFYSAGADAPRIAAARKEAAALQRELWAHAAAAAKEAPTPITATFINTLNETIDIETTRLNELRARVPGAVWMLVLVVAGMGCFASGYNAGACGARTSFSDALLPLLIATVITLISDFDHPRQGLVTISQSPLLDLKASISAPQIDKP